MYKDTADTGEEPPIKFDADQDRASQDGDWSLGMSPKFREFVAPIMSEIHETLQGKTIEYKKEDLFNEIDLLPHQAAIVSTVFAKIRHIRGIENVYGYSHKEFDHRFFTSEEFLHPEDYQATVYQTRMALFNELKLRSVPMKTEYVMSARLKHKEGHYLMSRISLTTFNKGLLGVPISALFIFSSYGQVDTGLSSGLLINSREPFIKDAKTGRVVRADIPFSRREQEVLYRICLGKSSKMIAEEMGIAKKTVDNFRTIILEKTGLSNTAEPCTHAVSRGWV